MLVDKELKEIRSLLNAHFDIDQLKQLLFEAGESWDNVVKQPTIKPSAITDILNDVKTNGWTVNFLTAIITVFESRKPVRPVADIDAVEKILSAVTARLGRGTALADPFESCFARNGQPYVNRPRVREAYQQLTNPGGARILVVNGPAESGKSYSKELPCFVADLNQSFHVYYHDLSEDPNPWTVETLVRSILRAWHLDESVPTQFSLDRASELGEWLGAQTPNGEIWWIIIDGLAKIVPSPDLLDFLNALAIHVANTTPTALRLVLLDMGADNRLPPSVEVVTNELKINRWTVNELVDHYFKTLHLIQRNGVQFDDQAPTAKAQLILQQVSDESDRVKRYAMLRSLLKDAAEEFGYV